jgi:polyferredoxin
MSQSKVNSAVETIISVGVGYIISLLLNLYFLPIFVVDISNQILSTAIIIGLVYTGVSLIRSYCFRRFFEKRAETYNNNIIQ